MLESLRSIFQAVNAAGDLRAVLEIMVTRISEVMKTEICTVYLRDPETGRYVFMANRGFDPGLVGKLSLAPDKGLIGVVGRREEPLNLENAATHADFELMPELGEEVYSAFLGVPIIHQREVLGVLVVQQREQRRFDEEEEAFLVTMSAQLSGVIAHARATGSIHLEDRESVEGGARFRGIAGAAGIAMGTAVVSVPVADLSAVPSRLSDDPAIELRLFKECLEAVKRDIRQIGDKLAEQLSKEERALFDVYLGMLEDSALVSEVNDMIAEGEWAQGALSRVMLNHVRTFEMMDDPYLKERAVDVKDLGRRVLAYLQAADTSPVTYPDKTILVGEELTASMLGEVPQDKLCGLVSVKGSGNSHVAILARAMGIPTVMGAVDVPYTRLDGQELIVDGYSGYVHYQPSQAVKARYEAVHREEGELRKELEGVREKTCETTDGFVIPLWVNTGLMTDVAHSITQGAEGVGLYRTEIPFLMRERFPTEEEQRKIYREQLEAFSPMPVTMRTLDVGGDKALPYFPIKEENPFLGWRGIRVTLDHPEIFLSQVRAMLKASEGLDNLRIMLPMISNIPELEEALSLIRRSYEELLADGYRLEKPPIGVMVEVPAAVYQARQLARRVDFLSVGSNDLTQYLLAVDRNNSRVAQLYHAYHPAVLQALKAVADAAHEEGRPVSICGELAGDPGAALLLLAMGYDVLSMNANSLLRVKWVLRNTSHDLARKLLNSAMLLESSEEIHELLRHTLEQAGVARLLRPDAGELIS